MTEKKDVSCMCVHLDIVHVEHMSLIIDGYIFVQIQVQPL